jgi:hypothetical protein
VCGELLAKEVKMGAQPWDLQNAERDPLLHQLLRSGLVERGPNGSGWRLSDLAQRRLAELVTPPPPADKVVHFGHHCAACGELRPTRQRGTRYLCAACDTTPPTADADPADSPRRSA